MADQQLKALLEKYVLENISPEEAAQLAGMLQDADQREEIERFIDSYFQGYDPAGAGDPALRDEIKDRLRASIRRPAPAARVFSMKKAGVWAAACVAAVIFSGAWYFYRSGGQAVVKSVSSSQPLAHDVAPGGNKAILTLSNGKKLVLDSAADGFLAQQGAARIVKLGNGQLAYDVGREPAKDVAYNTLSTPPGGQFQLMLPDGTKVWLDAASSITYPSSFTGTVRKVEITGQAYLEVAKNERMPFFVEKGNMRIEVLGTQFNINAYDDERAISTTLVEGSVKVLEGDEAIQLRPGQQAQLSREGRLSLSQNVDLEAVVAWKAGSFRFRGADIETVMREVARWYDVTVQYEGGKVNQTIYGTIPRTVSAASMFKVLEEAGGVHFKIEGKKVVVTP